MTTLNQPTTDSNFLKNFDDSTKQSRAVLHLQNILVKDEYGSPQDLVLEACNRYKINIKIDYAGSDKLHVVDRYYTKQDNALTKEWTEDGYLNAPYSLQYLFMKHAWEQHKKHKINLLILAYTKSDTEWWHSFVEDKAEVHFIRGRIRFNDENGIPMVNKDPRSKYYGKPQVAPYPSCFIIYRRSKRFSLFF